MIVERAATRFNICCMLEEMFDRNQNILPTQNLQQTSSNMHATRSNIVDPTICFITTFQRVSSRGLSRLLLATYNGIISDVTVYYLQTDIKR